MSPQSQQLNCEKEQWEQEKKQKANTVNVAAEQEALEALLLNKYVQDSTFIAHATNDNVPVQVQTIFLLLTQHLVKNTLSGVRLHLRCCFCLKNANFP